MFDKVKLVSWTAVGLTAALGVMGCIAPSAEDAQPTKHGGSEGGEADHGKRQMVDRKSMAEAIARRDQLPAAPLSGSSHGGIHPNAVYPFWQYLGPNSFHQSMNASGFNDTQSGRINAVAFDPQHNGTWYAGAPWGGVWKSTDFGSHWAPLTDTWKYLQVSSIAIDPNNSNNIYVGTGDFPGGSAYALGVMKSTDGGATWSNVGLFNMTIPKIVVDPDNSSNIIAVTSWGNVYRSTDAGSSWNSVINVGTDWDDVVFSPPDFFFPRHFYVVGNGTGGLLYRSDDHGATWTKLATPLSSNNHYGMALATSFINPERIYLFAPTDKKLLVSQNLGATWTDITGNLLKDDWFWDQTGYNYALAVSTVGDGKLGGTGQDVVWVASTDLYQNVGATQAWTGINSGHADNHAFAIDPFDRNALLLGNDGGVYNLTYQPELGTTTTFSVNQTLGVTEFYHAAFSTYDPDWIMGGTQDTGNPFSNSTLNNWLEAGGGDGGGAGVNPLNKNWMYLTWNWDNDQRTMLRTDNAWQSSQNITPSTNKEPGSLNVPVTVDPSQPWKVYTATNYLYKYDENTHAWTNHLGNQKLTSTDWAGVNYIAVADSDSNRIYTASGDGQLWMTTDGGSTWKEIDTGSVSGQNLQTLSVNPRNANDILVGIWRDDGRSHLWRCTNPFANPIVWTDVSAQSTSQGLPRVPVLSLAREPSVPDTNWYAATDVGVFYTDDAGAHWYNATAPLGLPNVPVSKLTAVSQTGYLYAATYGRGVWRAKLGCQPKSCASTNSNCGTISDGCGGTRDCGTCTAPATCGGGGTPNVCAVCQPLTCGDGLCGTMSDGCGGTIACGGCPVGEMCSTHQCVRKCSSPQQCCIQNDGCSWRNGRCICI